MSHLIHGHEPDSPDNCLVCLGEVKGNCPRCNKAWIIHDCPVKSNGVDITLMTPTEREDKDWDVVMRILDEEIQNGMNEPDYGDALSRLVSLLSTERQKHQEEMEKVRKHLMELMGSKLNDTREVNYAYQVCCSQILEFMDALSRPKEDEY